MSDIKSNVSLPILLVKYKSSTFAHAEMNSYCFQTPIPASKPLCPPDPEWDLAYFAIYVKRKKCHFPTQMLSQIDQLDLTYIDICQWIFNTFRCGCFPKCHSQLLQICPNMKSSLLYPYTQGNQLAIFFKLYADGSVAIRPDLILVFRVGDAT